MKSWSMEISIEVIDGIHGQPAEGVAVSFVSPLGSTETERLDQRTDHLGRVRYSGHQVGKADGKTCRIEIDAHIYFATLGIDCCQRKVVVFFHPDGPDDEYDIRSLIAPSMQSIYCVRRRGAASRQ
jgi:5-hydroxyisourate hydrolase-like protein (transthyretin family)